MAAKLFFGPVVKSLANAAAKRASSPIAKGLVKGAGVLGAGASVSEKVDSYLTEQLAGSSSAMDYRLGIIEALHEAAKDYHRAYTEIEANLERYGDNLPFGARRATCDQYERLAELETLEGVIAEIRQQVEVSEAVVSEVVMRLDADIEESRRRRDEQRDHLQHVQQLERSRIRVPNPEKSRRIAEKISHDRAWAYDAQAAAQKDERENAKAKAVRIEKLASDAVGRLENITLLMRQQPGLFVYLDKELCAEWQEALDL